MDALESTLRPLLTPITQNLPAPLPQLATQLLGPVCYTSLVENISLSDAACLKLAVSKTLGVGIIAASSIVKIPQLLKLLNSQSAAGISFLSYALETASYLVTLVYNIRNGWPFSTYGETALIAVQNVAIAVLVLKYSGKGAAGIAFVAGLAALGWTLFNEGLVDMGRLRLVQGAAGVLGVASKLPQIATIYSQGSTGQLSAFAVFNFLAGSLARIFTTLQEVDDKLILYGYLVGFALNLVLAVQMVWYWNSSSSKAKKSKSKKSGKKAIEQTVGGGGKAKSSGAEKGKSPSTRRRG